MSGLSESAREKLTAVSTATLTTLLMKHGLRNRCMQGVSRLTTHDRNMVGEAFTLRNIPAREDIDVVAAYDDYDHPQRRAIETVPPGKILVIDARQDPTAATAGNILMTRLEVRGVAGFVSDGGVRDSSEIAEYDIPCYVSGPSAPTSLIKHHAVEELNTPIGCGGVAVYPDDVLVGDDEGVVVIPAHLAEEIADKAFEQEQMEAFISQEVRGGRPLRGTYPPDADTKARYEEWRKEKENS
ncbi:ribonuclease activity regulator RraA [Nisaea sp.]|uniref:ribonuclease activity regulator RraA n=1 Tax=Nisaea sp. TaxID=2024842 RepID=UPI003B5280F6